MSSLKGKGSPEDPKEVKQQDISPELTPQPAPLMPQQVLHQIYNFFRVLGLNTDIYDNGSMNSVDVVLADGSKIHIVGGEWGAFIGISLYYKSPDFTFPEKAIAALEKLVNMHTEFVAHNYLDLRPREGDYADSSIEFRKLTDTQDPKIVMRELKSATEILGIYQPHKNKTKRKRGTRR